MTQTVIETNNKFRGILIGFLIVVAIVAIVWAAIVLLSPEEPTTKPVPKPTPCVCEEVKPPTELPETGVSL